MISLHLELYNKKFAKQMRFADKLNYILHKHIFNILKMILFESKNAGHYRQPASDICDGLFIRELRDTGRVCTHLL